MGKTTISLRGNSGDVCLTSIVQIWILYIMVMAGWNTFCKGCPAKWYSTNVHPYIPKPEPKPEPPVIEDDDEDWEDSEWE